MTSDGSSSFAATPARTPHLIDERSIRLQRIIHAPCDLVFLAWTDPVHVARWWGPHGFRSVVRQMDVVVGGQFRICMIAPDGTEYPIKATYEEIVVPERLVYIDDWDDDRPSQQSRVTVTFQAQGPEQTLLTLEMVFATDAEREEAQSQQIIPGWGETFERLDSYLAER
jgi:uncharacterized protein YndB with AHSA1/START domain